MVNYTEENITRSQRTGSKQTWVCGGEVSGHVKFSFSFATTFLTGKYEFPRPVTHLKVNQCNSSELKSGSAYVS